MAIPQQGRKAMLAVHLLVSIGWIGAVLSYLALGTAAAFSDDPAVIRSGWLGMELIGWWVAVPLAGASLITGIALSLLTRWGLFRHYWVVVALSLTTLCTGVLVLHMPTVSVTATEARTASPERLVELGGDLPHPTIGLVLLLAILVLNIYKPQGLTRRGWRLQQRRPRAR